jgi:hypothetical protein
MISKALAVVLLGASVATWHLQLKWRGPEPVFIAVVRQDGSMVPLAASDGRQWWNRWPVEFDPDAVPADLRSVPRSWLPPGTRLPERWEMTIAGGRRSTLHVLKPIVTTLLEEQTIGLQTDAVIDAAGSNALQGLAVTGGARAGGFVSATPAETAGLGAQLTPRILEIEAEEIRRWAKDTQRSSSVIAGLREVTRPGEVQESLIGFRRAELGVPGRVFYHAAGQRLYEGAVPATPDCKMNMSFEGVVITDVEGRVISESLSAFAYAEYCGDAASWSEPIGAVQVGNQLIWVYQENLEDGYFYGLVAAAGDQLNMRAFPFVRVPVSFRNDGCRDRDLCAVLSQLRLIVRSRDLTALKAFVVPAALHSRTNSRNLLTELEDPSAAAWSALSRLLSLGGQLQRWDTGPSYCAPGITRSDASPERTQQFTDGVGLVTVATVLALRTPVFAEPRSDSAVVADVGHELIAVVEPTRWDSPDADQSWVKVRVDRTDGYVRRRQIRLPNDPGLCLDHKDGSWKISYFMTQDR